MRKSFKTISFFCFMFFSFIDVKAINIDKLVQKSNIYYQQPLPGYLKEVQIRSVENMKSKKDLKFIIHGFVGDRFHASIRPLGHAYMVNGFENVFLADWRAAAHLDYLTSRKAVGKVAAYFAQLLEELINKHEIPPAEVHIIGHSLGAHIAGNIGRHFNGSLGRITGLDPALPLFTPSSADSIQSNCGVFVDIIHTDFPVFGDITPRGTVDFYPNYGYTPQKGCDDDALLTASKLLFMAYSCSHNRAVTLYAESIGWPKTFPTQPCSLSAIRIRKASMCSKRFNVVGLIKSKGVAGNENQDNVVYMGEFVAKNASGIFYLETYDAPPYGMGANGRRGLTE